MDDLADEYDSNAGAAHFDPCGSLRAERDRYRDALQEIAKPPTGDEDALDLLQEKWAVAAMALSDKVG